MGEQPPVSIANAAASGAVSFCRCVDEVNRVPLRGLYAGTLTTVASGGDRVNVVVAETTVRRSPRVGSGARLPGARTAPRLLAGPDV
jgi:hypothetical protein